MKLKARDIMPGWPRGRSTMNLYDRCMFGFICWLHCWSPQDIMRLEMDLLASTKYHQHQAEMMENFRKVNNAFRR